MDPRNNKGKGVSSSQPSRAGPYPRGGRGEASSSWDAAPYPRGGRGEASSSWDAVPYPRGGRGEASSSWQRPIPPVLGQMPQIPMVGLWDNALLAEPQMRTMDAHTLEALYSPGYVGVGRVAATRPLKAPPPRVPPPHPHTAAPASYSQALVTGLRPQMAPSPPPQQQQQRPTVDIEGEAVRVARQMQAMEEGQRDLRMGRVAASRPLEAPAPPPHQQFGPQQSRYRASEACSSGGHISSFDAGADARRLARNSRANPYHQAPVAALRLPMAPSSNTANSSTSQQLYAMDPRTWIDAYDPLHPAPPAYIPSTNFDPFPRSDPSSSRQHQQRYAAPPTSLQPPLFGPQRYAGWEWDPPISRLEVVQSQLLHDVMVLEGLVMNPESSALVVQLLQEGGQVIPWRVLDEFVRYAAHSVMGNRQGHAVFNALLRSFLGRYIELEVIVGAVPNRVWTSNDGVAALKLLITAVRGQPRLPMQLVGRLVREGVMEHARGNELIVHCFTEMGYEAEATKFLIGHALRTIWHMLQSPAGSACLFTCFRYARQEQYQDFVNFILDDNAARMARGRYSNYFVQRVLDDGDGEFRRDLVLELMKDVASLSLDHYGSFVVGHCFLNRETGSPQLDLLPLVLTAYTDLGTRDIERLVETHPGNLVLIRLLETGYNHYRELTLGLAHKIDLLVSPSVRRNPQSRMVLSYVERVRYI